MFPLHDSIAPRTFPWVTYIIIGLCTVAFALQSAYGPNDNRIVEQYGMIPARVLADSIQERDLTIQRAEVVQTPYGMQPELVEQPMPRAGLSDWMTLLTCMFLHGGLMHFAGNMWFLHIFGDNVEDRFGHFLYAVVYGCAGVIAGLTHLVSNPGSTVPTIGASGAIAGVMGAYILLYPKSVVETLIPLPFIFTTISVPAPIFLGIWFVMQVFQGASGDATGGGVAWWAHVGGFVAGLLAAVVLSATHIASPPSDDRRFGFLGLQSR
jgi:membrane associated rhomboid family serine protease